MKIKVQDDIVYFLDVNGVNYAIPTYSDSTSIENTIMMMARDITTANLLYIVEKYGLLK